MRNCMFAAGASNVPNEQAYLKRPCIHDLLARAIQKPVVTVVAGAGYGKTQAVHMFLRECQTLSVWIQITMLDNLGARFWDHFVDVLSRRSVTLASTLEALGLPDTTAKFDMFLSCLLEHMEPNQKYAVVYDDIHLLHERNTLRFIENFLNAGIPNLSFILISRNEPQINTVRYLAGEKIAMISESDLRFSKEDVVHYFEMRNIHVSPRLLSKMYDHTEGWIMAIRLMELSIQKGVAHSEYAITAMKQNIYRLIESDVYSNLSEETKVFLVKLSLFDNLPLDLLEALSPGDRRVLHDISKIHSFIRFDSFSGMCYIHHLFHGFLRRKQDVLTQNEREECFVRAAGWYASHGYTIDAITYYGKAGDYKGILSIALFWPHASAEEGALVLGIMEKAPKDVYDDPKIALLHARAFYFLGNIEEYMNRFGEVIKRQEALPQTRENLVALHELYALAGVVYYYTSNYTDDFHFAEYIMRAHAFLKAENISMEPEYKFQDVGSYVCRIRSEKKADMETYMEAARNTVDCASSLMAGCMCGIYDLTQCELYYFQNSQKLAEKSATLALQKAREHNQHAIAMRAIFFLIRIALTEANQQKIQGCIGQLDSQLQIDNSPVFKTLHDIAIGWLYSQLGLGDRVANWIKSDSEKSGLNAIASGSEFLVKAKYYLCEKKYYELLCFLELQESGNDIGSFLFGKIATAGYRAVCLYHTGQKEDAVAMLHEAYLLAEPNAITMQFIELGNSMVALAKHAIKSEKCQTPKEWLNGILKKASAYAKKVSRAALEYRRAHHLEKEVLLTQKELRLLYDVFHGLTRAEIAARHNLSPNYVKNRLQSIYTKLGAESANDAIRIAILKKIISFNSECSPMGGSAGRRSP